MGKAFFIGMSSTTGKQNIMVGENGV